MIVVTEAYIESALLQNIEDKIFANYGTQHVTFLLLKYLTKESITPEALIKVKGKY